MTRWIVAGLFLLARAAPAAAQTPADSLLTQLYAYDATLPLNARSIDRFDTLTFTREKIVFDGWLGTRVPGLVGVPKNAVARHPVVVLIDGIGGWKERWWSPTGWSRGRILVDSLLAAGYAVAMIDAWGSGERSRENDFASVEPFVNKPAQLRDLIFRNVIEHRRLIDYLLTRADIDSARIGVLGLSLGGMNVLQLGSVDARVQVIVAGLVPVYRNPSVISPSNYVARVHAPTLLLMGRTDAYYTKEQAERVFGMLAAKDKDLRWYDAGHRLPPEYAGAAVAWLRRFLP